MNIRDFLVAPDLTPFTRRLVVWPAALIAIGVSLEPMGGIKLLGVLAVLALFWLARVP